MRHIMLFLASATLICAASRDSGKVFDLLKKGSALSSAESEALERRLQSKAGDEEARIELLAYYAAFQPGPEAGAIKAARLRHILYLIAHDPKAGFGLFQVATRVYHLNCRGDAFADPEGFLQVKDLWLEQVRKNPKDEAIRTEAVDAMRYCAPEEAEALLKKSGDSTGLGKLYADAVLGITGYDYRSSDPSGTDSALRGTPFAQRALQILGTPAAADLIAGAARTILERGANLWADGKLDWDYTGLGTALRDKALQAAPHEFRLVTLPTALPQRGERPPATLTIGGNVLQKRLVHQSPPVYPNAAKVAGVQGTVKFSTLIGLDGRIVDLHLLSGPSELVESATAAVSQWRYQPTLLNGKPCYVITQIDVNYVLGR